MHSTVHHNLCLTHHKHTSEPPETLPVKPIIWCSSPMNLLPLCISGEEILNGYWLNKLIRAWNNENAKWEVWDHSLAGEVNVALWGQSDCPVAHCNSDRKEQWDITHPGNIAQRVRGVTWLCFCLSVLESHVHKWIKVAALEIIFYREHYVHHSVVKTGQHWSVRVKTQKQRTRQPERGIEVITD